jgi:hypothetical protein
VSAGGRSYPRSGALGYPRQAQAYFAPPEAEGIDYLVRVTPDPPDIKMAI